MGYEEEEKKAEKIALRMLTLRPRTTLEIKNKLSEEGVSRATIDKILGRLSEYGYLNDRTFAFDLATMLVDKKGWGYARIGAMLRERGVAQDVANDVVSQLKTERSEEETALRLAQRRFSHINCHAASQREKNRIALFFRRRGFSWETIARVLDR